MDLGQELFRLVGLRFGDGLERYVVVGALASAAVSVDTVHTLYNLTLHHFGSPAFALLTSLLSLLCSSPATLRHAPCTEPFFTYLSYKGEDTCLSTSMHTADRL